MTIIHTGLNNHQNNKFFKSVDYHEKAWTAKYRYKYFYNNLHNYNIKAYYQSTIPFKRFFLSTLIFLEDNNKNLKNLFPSNI